MEATFQSYLTEAVYEAVASTRGGSHQRDQISFIDDSDGEQQQNQLLQQQLPPPLPVKMRVKNAAAGAAGGRHRGPRPSGILEQQQDPSPITSFRTSSSQPPASSSNPSAIPFWPPPRHSKFGLSVKRRLSPNSSSNFYLQRSQSTKEVGSNFSLFKNFGLKRTPTWSSVVAHLNRSFRAASTTSNVETAGSTAESRIVEGGSKPDKVWKRSQSCRNIERLFYNRRYYHNEKFSLNSVSLFEDYIWYIHMGKCMAFKARKMGSVNR